MKCMLGRCLQTSLASGGGLGEGRGPGTPLHMEASLASAFLVLLRRRRASPALALFPGVEVGSRTHPQSLWHKPWGVAPGPLANCFWVVPSHLGFLSAGCERRTGARQVNWQFFSPLQTSRPHRALLMCPMSKLKAPSLHEPDSFQSRMLRSACCTRSLGRSRQQPRVCKEAVQSIQWRYASQGGLSLPQVTVPPQHRPVPTPSPSLPCTQSQHPGSTSALSCSGSQCSC